MKTINNIAKLAISYIVILSILIGLATTTVEAETFAYKWGSTGSGDGQFNGPISIAVDPSGNVYVVDMGNDRIQKFSSTGEFITKWGSTGSGDGQFKYPSGIAIDPSGNVYIADAGNDRIQKFSSTGEFITKFGSNGSEDGQFNYPYGIAVDLSGNVYVSDENHRIQKFSSTGEFITKWGTRGGWGKEQDGQFNTPIGIAVDSYGSVYVADMENNRIQKFSSTGEFITKWGSEGNGDGQFTYPVGIAIDKSGNIYVADDQINNRIQKFSSTGEFITKWGSEGSEDGQFIFDYSNVIAIDYSSGNIYVADTGNNRIQVFKGISSSDKFVYVALGDSYQSGEGVGTPLTDTNDYLTAYENGENYPTQINTYSNEVKSGGDSCHRALKNYAKLYSDSLKSGINDEDIILIDTTCSGAKIVPGIEVDEKPPIVSVSDSPSMNAPPFYCLGGIQGGDQPSICNYKDSQVKQAIEQLKSKGLTIDDVDLVTIGMGGNDIRFDEIVSACVKSSFIHRLAEIDPKFGVILYAYGELKTCEQTDQNELYTDRDMSTLKYKENWAQNKIIEIFNKAEILQLNYPNILPVKSQSSYQFCGGIRNEDFDFMNRKLTQINNIVKESANSHNGKIKLVDVQDAFGDNPICPYKNATANGINIDNFYTEVDRIHNNVPILELKNYAKQNERTMRANFISPPNGESEDIRYDRSAGLFHPNDKGHEILSCKVQKAVQGSSESCPIPDIGTIPDPVPVPTPEMPSLSSSSIQEAIKPNEKKMYTVPIDSTTKKANFNIFWQGSDLDLILYTPNGIKIDPSIAKNNSNINYTSGATFESYDIQSPEQGNWKMEVTAINVSSDGENYSFITLLDTNLSLIVKTDKKSYVANESMTISAYMQDNGTLLPQAEIISTVSKSDGTYNMLQLYDDGLHNDNQSGDGIYSNIYKDTNMGGSYLIVTNANISIKGESINRTAFNNIWIRKYPDLAITSDDINLLNDSSGENVTVSAIIHNIGYEDANNASILFYDGDPANGKLINEDIINVKVGQNVTAYGSWNATDNEIYVLINPYSEFIEQNYSNNEASKKGISIDTDKTSYYQGEPVNITLKNNYPYSVHVTIGSNSCDRFRIYNEENSTYVDLIGDKVCAAVILEKDVSPGGTIEEVWNQKDGYGNQVPNGKYRVEIANYSSDTFTIDKKYDTITNSVGIEFVQIPAGEFDMGAPPNQSGNEFGYEAPVHRVNIAKAFYMGRYEVTQKQWSDIMGTNPSYYIGENLPVQNVSWDDTQEFIRKLNEKEGTNKYRLPSEAEWEYTIRAGTTTLYSFGNDESKIAEYAWYSGNSGHVPHEVGLKKPNPWGLYDMHGNVWEWVQDKWHENYKGAPIDGSVWEGDSVLHTLRGGGWGHGPKEVRSAYRFYGDINSRNGFRIVKDL